MVPIAQERVYRNAYRYGVGEPMPPWMVDAMAGPSPVVWPTGTGFSGFGIARRRHGEPDQFGSIGDYILQLPGGTLICCSPRQFPLWRHQPERRLFKDIP